MTLLDWHYWAIAWFSTTILIVRLPNIINNLQDLVTFPNMTMTAPFGRTKFLLFFS